MNLNQLFCEMIQYYRNDPKRIQHFTKVHSYAKLIGELSGMQGEELLTLEVAAYVHDIGIKVAGRKSMEAVTAGFRSRKGRQWQRICLAECILTKKSSGECPIWSDITTLMTRLTVWITRYWWRQLSAVNLYEDGVTKEAVMHAYNKIFRTEHGKRICAEMFGIEE